MCVPVLQTYDYLHVSNYRVFETSRRKLFFFTWCLFVYTLLVAFRWSLRKGSHVHVLQLFVVQIKKTGCTVTFCSMQDLFLSAYRHGCAWKFEICAWRFGNPSLKNIEIYPAHTRNKVMSVCELTNKRRECIEEQGRPSSLSARRQPSPQLWRPPLPLSFFILSIFSLFVALPRFCFSVA